MVSIQQSTRKEINHDITPIVKQKLMYSSVTCNNKNSMNIIKPMNNMNINESHSQGFSALAALTNSRVLVSANVAQDHGECGDAKECGSAENTLDIYGVLQFGNIFSTFW